jgi:hypothetical protein
MYLDIIGEIEEIETIAVGGKIQDIMRIRKQFDPGDGANLKVWQMSVFRVEGYLRQRSTGRKPTVLVERR